MEIVKLKLKDIKPYAKNARKNDDAVNAVMESIKQCEYIAPIIPFTEIDKIGAGMYKGEKVSREERHNKSPH